MRTRTITVVVTHDDSLFPDEGALVAHITNILLARRTGIHVDGRGITAVTVTERTRK